MKRMSLFLLFLCGAPLTLILSLLLATNSSPVIQTPRELIDPQHQRIVGSQIFSSLPETALTTTSQITAGDARVKILQTYLEGFGSPLASESATIVEAADKYHLDFRLVPAIARQESNGCKFIPPGSHNCWGWGIHARGTLHFDSLKEGIFTVSEGLRENYLDDGLTTPEKIMSRYTPSSPGTWSAAVEQFMLEME